MQPQIKQQQADWTQAMRELITDPLELLALLQLEPEQVGLSVDAAKQFPLRVSYSFVKRMRVADPNDPLLKQVLSVQQELQPVIGFELDPVKEKEVNPVPGLLHKYHGRVLLTVTGACGIHCRYCFRRHFDYQANNPGQLGWQQAINYIANDNSIEEVIFSGGDPLVLKDEQLESLAQRIATIPHVKRLRIHTRMPIIMPQRVTKKLASWLTNISLPVIIVLHSNHANEINAEVMQALHILQKSGATLLNQAVLLKGINDSESALLDLSKQLFAAGVLPYYLHLLDKVQGAAHFDVSEQRAKQLVWQVSQKLSGYLVPKLVREESGVGAKVPVSL